MPNNARHVHPDLTNGPWAKIIQRYVDHYGNICCVRWNEPLVYLQDGIPTPVEFEDRVLRGIARKTAVTLQGVCSKCGAKGTPRQMGRSWRVLCLGCHGKATLVADIGHLLVSLELAPTKPFDGMPAAWFFEKMSPAVRRVIPDECWRKVQFKDGTIVKYLIREDLRELTPWLKKLQGAMLGTLKRERKTEAGDGVNGV